LSTDCTSCDSPLVLSDTECSLSCKVGNIYSALVDRCVPCEFDCETCTSLSVTGCITCIVGKFLHLGECIT
jgi:hypothetical protein